MAWNIFTNGKQTLGLNLSERFSITDNALIDMKVTKILCLIFNPCFQWPDMDVTRMDQSETIQMFKSKLRFQIRFQGLWIIKSKLFFTQTWRLPTEDQPRRRGHPEYPQLHGHGVNAVHTGCPQHPARPEQRSRAGIWPGTWETNQDRNYT